MQLTANGIELHYEETGAGAPLLFIHGLGSSTLDWEHQIPFFSPHYRVVTFDLRGHGQSEKPPGPYSIPLFAADTAALVTALNAAPAHVVGLSLGGCVAFQMAADHPELFKSMVIVNSGPVGLSDSGEGKKEVEARVAIVKQMGMRGMGEALGQRLFSAPGMEETRKTFVERWAQNDPRAYLDSLYSMVEWDITSQIGNIRVPTLALTSDQDYTPVAMKEAYVSQMPNAEVVVIPDAHHALPTEHPNEFNAALGKFLDKHR